MIALAKGLKAFLERHFIEAVAQGSEVVRPILVGPPESALESLFNLLSSAGTGDWHLAAGLQQLDITVLLLSGASTAVGDMPGGQFLSRRCQWDYAVTVRNSRPFVLMLASSAAWDNRPESLANTTETLGSPTTGRGGFRDSSWKHLVRLASITKELEEGLIRYALQEVTRQARSLEPLVRDRVAWIVMDALLGETPAGLIGDDIVNAAAGFASTGLSGIPVKTSAQAVVSLASFLGKHGLINGIDMLRSTSVSQAESLIGSLDSLLAHLTESALSSADFDGAPAWYYRCGDPVPDWWYRLDTSTLQELLDEADDRPRIRLALNCENALNVSNKLPGEPFIVGQVVQLRASAPGATLLAGAVFSRKAERLQPVTLAVTPMDPNICIDMSPVGHRKPLKYTVSTAGANPGAVEVLVLDTFGCGGTAHVRNADKNTPPTLAKESQVWTQHIVLRQGGASELRVYHTSAASSITIEQSGELPNRQSTVAGSSFVTFNLDLEDDGVIDISLHDDYGASVGGWSVTFNIQEVTDVARSRLEALIQEHRTGRRSVPRPEDTSVQRAEGTCYLASPDSWKPVLACWSSVDPGWLDIDWVEAKLGDVEPQIDPRPSVSPPESVLAAREAVRQYLQATGLTICEIEFNHPSLVALVEDYVSVYMAWLSQFPYEATWLDTLAIHSAGWNAQAGHHVPSDEPFVVLLSPLHPLRLGWHCIAQQQLSDGLGRKCAAAGLLDPSSSPDAGVFYLNTGQNIIGRAFFSLPCKNPHWVVLINCSSLSQDSERVSVFRQVASLGLDVQGVAGGFSIPQAIDSLREVTRLLPARATLRVGLVGTQENSTDCAGGVIEWCKEPFGEEETGEIRPYQVEVFDTRGAMDPSPEQLAALSETTNESVKWFKLTPDESTPQLDLTIIDQLGTGSPGATSGEPRSAIGSGSLYRVRVRQDSQNAKILSESRVGREVSGSTNFASRVQQAIQQFEALALKDNDSSQFRFRPNQAAIGARLNKSTFLAVTSSQIDPACIVRGVSGQNGYLWDYELPGMLGGTESNAGYYLLAKPQEAMRTAIKRSAALIVSSPPDPEGLLEEISRHGIPILKRLASGGSRSRGEARTSLGSSPTARRVSRKCFVSAPASLGR